MKKYFLVATFGIALTFCPAFADSLNSAYELYKGGQYDKALKTIETKENKTAEDALLKYEIYKKQNKRSQAKNALKEGISLDPGCYEGYIALGILYLEDSDPKNAKECFESAFKINPDLSKSAEILYYFAQICILDNDFDNALKNILSAIEINGFEPSYYLELGKIYLYKDDFLHAVNSLEYAIGTDTKINSAAYNYIGLANYKRGNFLVALENFKKASELVPSIINLNNLSMCYKSLSDNENYMKVIEKMNTLTPFSAEEYLQFSQLLYDKKNKEAAVKTLREGLNKYPDNLSLKTAFKQLNKL